MPFSDAKIRNLKAPNKQYKVADFDSSYLRTETLFGPDDTLFTPPEMGVRDGQFAVFGLKRKTYQSANAIRKAFKSAFETADLPTFASRSFRKTLTKWADQHYPTRDAFEAFS